MGLGLILLAGAVFAGSRYFDWGPFAQAGSADPYATGAPDIPVESLDPGLASASPEPSASALVPTPSAKVSTVPTTKAPAPQPGPCGTYPKMPNATCTGWAHTGVTLKTCPGRLATDNATYEGCHFTGGITVAASNVTVKSSKVSGRVGASGTNGDLRRLLLIDVEIDGGDDPDFNQAAIGSSNFTCLRCNIHSTGRGANLSNNVTIQDSYIHDFVYSAGAHQTAIGAHGGGNYKIIHNNLVCNSNSEGCSAALSFYGDDSQINGALVQYNLFNTDGGYCTYAGSVGGKPYPHAINVRYLSNLFGKSMNPKCGWYGPVASWERNAGNEWTGNAWQDGSGPVNAPGS